MSEKKRTIARGFTLVEMIVTLGVIILIATIALPSAISLFNGGTDAQAYNLMASQLAAARAYAIENSTYAGVHGQLVRQNYPFATAVSPDAETAYYTAIVTYMPVKTGGYSPIDSSRVYYYPVAGTARRMPAGIAFGKLQGGVWVSGGWQSVTSGGTSYGGGLLVDDNSAGRIPPNIHRFISFTVMFSPSGQVVQAKNGLRFSADLSHPMFNGNDERQLWDAATANQFQSPTASGDYGAYGVSAMTMFNLFQLRGLPAAKRAAYLNESGQFLAVNVYTGQLFPRK